MRGLSEERNLNRSWTGRVIAFGQVLVGDTGLRSLLGPEGTVVRFTNGQLAKGPSPREG